MCSARRTLQKCHRNSSLVGKFAGFALPNNRADAATLALGTRSRVASVLNFCTNASLKKRPPSKAANRRRGAFHGGKVFPCRIALRARRRCPPSPPPPRSSPRRRASRPASPARARPSPAPPGRAACSSFAPPPSRRRVRAPMFFPPCLRRAAWPAGSGARPRPSGATTSASMMRAPRLPRDRLVVSGLSAPLVDRAVVIFFFRPPRRADDATRLSNPSPDRPPAPEGGRRARGRHPLLSFHRRRRRGSRSRGASLRRSLPRASPPLAAAETV